MKYIFTTIILALLSQPVWALEVFYCVESQAKIFHEYEEESLALERFSMAIDRGTKTVTISNPRFQRPLKLEIESMSKETNTFEAVRKFLNTTGAVAKFDNGFLFFSIIDTFYIDVSIAKCETF